MGSALDEFSHAVICSFDQAADPQLRSGATSSLEALKHSADAWQFCLQALSVTQEERVKFWCLQTLVDLVKGGRYGALAEHEQAAMRTSLLAWAQSKGAPQTDEAPFVKNKFAQLLVTLLRIDYPQRWPDFFQQMLGTLQNGAVAIDLFLRLLNSVHEEIVSSDSGAFDVQTAARVKDAMRDACLPQLADAWLSILQLHPTAPSLAASCLQTLAPYVSWIDINLVACPRFLDLFARFLLVPQLHEGACECLTEIVAKRMDGAAKLAHLVSLNVVGVLSDASTGVALTSAYAKLSAAVSLELLDCWDRLALRGPPSDETHEMAATASSQLRASLPLLLSCLAADDIEVSQCTMGFLHSYVGRLRKLLPSPKDVGAHADQLQHLLLVMARKSVHPADYNFDQPDETEEAFLAYRRELATLFKGVARVHPSLAQAFVHSMLQSTLQPSDYSAPPAASYPAALSSTCLGTQGACAGSYPGSYESALPPATDCAAPWAHVEVSLWLLFQLGEGLPDATIREKGGVFQQMMGLLLLSPVSAHAHHAVQLLYFEIVVRYYRFFLAQPEHLGGALQSFLDRRGLRNPSHHVRSRVCYLLLRFVKQTLKSATRDYLCAVHTVRDVLLQQGQLPAHQLAGGEHGDGSGRIGDGRGARGNCGAGGNGGSNAPCGSCGNGACVNGGAGSMNGCGGVSGCACSLYDCSPAAAPAAMVNGAAQPNGAPNPSSVRVGFAEQLNLYEVCGLLLGANLAPSEQVGELLECVLKPPLDQLQQLCADSLAGTSATSSAVSPLVMSGTNASAAESEALFATRAELAAHCISVVAVVSKGFSNLSAATALSNGSGLPRAAFVHAMRLALASLEPFGRSADVRAKALVLLHRMVETLSEDLVAFLNPALPQLLASADAREVSEVVTLMNQLILKFKNKIGSSVSQLVGPLTMSIFSLVSSLDAAIATSSSAGANANAPQSDDVRERRALLRSYYSFVHSLVHNDLTYVLGDGANSGHAAGMLRVLQQGCLEGPDMQLQRQCFVTLQKIVEAWGGSDPSFDQYVLNEMLPVCFGVFAQPHFTTSDAAALPLIESLIGLQRAMLSKLGSPFATYLADVHLPAAGCSADFAAQYCSLLNDGNVKELAGFLRQQLASASR